MLDRFTAKILWTETDCWEWQGWRTPKGYGQFSVKGKMTIAHRVSYRLFVGEIPEGLDLDHLCRNRACVNPHHLEPVSRKENLRRGAGKTGLPKATHCVNGHRFDEVTTYIKPNGYRGCKPCKKVTNQRSRERKKVEST